MTSQQLAGNRAETARPTPLCYVDFPVRIRQLEVIGTVWLSDTMIRLTAGGRGAAGFQSAIPDEHVKLVFPDPDTGELRLPTPDGDELEWPRPFPTSREYTIRAYRESEQEIDIDFVVHSGGLASDWVCAARPGDVLHVAGPPGGYQVGDDYDFYLLAGDETALPAMARWMSEMPADRVGHAVIAVPNPAAQQPVSAPGGVGVSWLWLDEAPADAFQAAVRGVEIPAGATVFVWLAGEAGLIRPLRRWVRDELGLDKYHSSITGYWKRGEADTHEHLDDEDEDEDE